MSITTAREDATRIDPDRLYTFAEIAEFCGGDVSERQVRRWTSEGKMPYTPLPGGRGRRISGRQYIEHIRSTGVPV